MSAPACCACCVRSRQSLADIAAVQACTTTSGLAAAAFLDRDLQQALSLVDGQRPELRDAAGAPQHRVPQLADAVAHQRPVGVPVDVVAVVAAERRVEAVADSAQRCSVPSRELPLAVAMIALRLGEVTTAVDVDVGAGHVRVAPRRQKRDDGPDLARAGRRAADAPGARSACRWRPSARRGRCRRRPTESAQPPATSEAMLPGETTLTMISSLASSNDRFFEMLVTIGLGGGVRGQNDALPLRRMGGEVDDPRPLRLAQQRKCRAHAVHHAHHAIVEGLPPLVVGEIFECAPTRSARRR